MIAGTGSTAAVRSPWATPAVATPVTEPAQALPASPPDAFVSTPSAGALPASPPDAFVSTLPADDLAAPPRPVAEPGLAPAMPLALESQEIPEASSALGPLARVGLAVMGAVMLAGAASPALAAPPAASVATTAIAASAAAETSLLDLDPATLPAQVVFSNPYLVEREIEQAAQRAQVPPDVLKAIAWQETGWQHYSHGNRVQRNPNRNKAGVVVSTDWGIIQINDRAHPRAFPRVKTDPRYNLEYGGRLLRSLYQENGTWEKAVERYNGISSVYPKAIKRHQAVKPWTVEVARGELRLHQAERQKVEARRSAASQLLAAREKRVDETRRLVEKLGGGIAETSLPSATRKALASATASLENARAEASAARATLAALESKAARLDPQISRLEEKVNQESARIKSIQQREEAEHKAAAAQRAQKHAPHAKGTHHRPA